MARYAPSLALGALLVGCLLVPAYDRTRARLRAVWQTRRWEREVEREKRRAETRRRVMRSYMNGGPEFVAAMERARRRLTEAEPVE